MQAILDRIRQRCDELKLSEAAVAQKGGSRDLIRNWRRALADGKVVSARYGSLEAIAKALHVTPEWLIHGAGDAPPPAPALSPHGMAEALTPFTLAPAATQGDDPQGAIRAIFGRTATTPGLFRVHKNLPAFELAKGDVVLADLARLPEPGEIAIVRVVDEVQASAKTLVCRYLPPYLTMGKIGPEVPVLRIDDPGVTVRHPVVGSIRGIPSD